MRRFSLIAGLVTLALIAGACGSEDEEPTAELTTTSSSDRSKIRGAVDRFNIAARGLDGKLLCNDVLPPSSVGRDPERCETAIDTLMRQNPDHWEPYDTVRKIKVRPPTAKARGLQGESRTTIRFVKEDGRWFVEVFD